MKSKCTNCESGNTSSTEVIENTNHYFTICDDCDAMARISTDGKLLEYVLD
jgi:transcription elongation factor Elf1